jgi:hypothetical protein
MDAFVRRDRHWPLRNDGTAALPYGTSLSKDDASDTVRRNKTIFARGLCEYGSSSPGPFAACRRAVLVRKRGPEGAQRYNSAHA